MDDTEDKTFSKKEIPGMFEGPILPLIAKLSLPMLFGMVVQLFYNVVDTIWVSRIDINDPSYVGGTGLIWPVVFFYIAMGGGISVGVNSLVARAIGEKNSSVLNKTAESGLLIAVILSVLTVLAVSLFGSDIVAAMGGVGDYYTHGLEYLYYLMPSAILFYVGAVFYGILQGEGLMKPMMNAMIMGTVANIILDPVFIFLLDMDVKGAAAATGLGQLISLIYVLRIFFRNKTLVAIKWSPKNASSAVIKKIIVIGVPQALGQVLVSVSFIVLNKMIITIDMLALTAFTLCGRMEQIVLMPSFAIGAAVITIVGQNGGRGNIERVARTMKSGFLAAGSATAVLAAVMVLTARFIYPFFSTDETVIRYAVLQTYYLEFIYIFAVFGIVGRSFFQAIGYPTPALLLTLLRVLIITLPASWFFAIVMDMDIPGIWLGVGTASLISGLISLYWIFRTVNRLKSGAVSIRHS